jgi:hypothetical protein
VTHSRQLHRWILFVAALVPFSGCGMLSPAANSAPISTAIWHRRAAVRRSSVGYSRRTKRHHTRTASHRSRSERRQAATPATSTAAARLAPLNLAIRAASSRPSSRKTRLHIRTRPARRPGAIRIAAQEPQRKMHRRPTHIPTTAPRRRTHRPIRPRLLRPTPPAGQLRLAFVQQREGDQRRHGRARIAWPMAMARRACSEYMFPARLCPPGAPFQRHPARSWLES